MRHLIELSGECESLARAEAVAACGSYGSTTAVEADGRALVLEAPVRPGELAGRLGLAWSVSGHVFSCAANDIEAHIREASLPPGSLRVRAARLDGAGGSGTSIARAIGKILSGTHPIDLEGPDFELRVLISGRLHVGILAGEVDRSSFEARKAGLRPFNHPISLHPKLARALVNLTRAGPGQVLLDPFCGTGGILIEAGMIGCRALGGDIDPRMVAGSRKNLTALGVRDAEVREADVSSWSSPAGAVDAIATDPPYGRSASTAKEPIGKLYARAFGACHSALKEGGRLAMVLPDEGHAALAKGFELEGMHPVRVHRSLTRYFCVFRR